MAGHLGTSTRGHHVEQIRGIADGARRDTLTTLTGKIVSYDAARQKATVSVDYKQKIGDAEYKAPDLLEVPVEHTRGGGAIFHTPMKAGDPVILSFGARSLENTIDADGSADEHPGRMADLSDAIARPAAISKGKELGSLPAGKHFFGTENGQSGVTIDQASGKVDMKGNGESPVKILKELIDLIKDHKHNNVPMDAGFIASCNALKSRLDAASDA
jgi:hypothetical protein